MMGEHCVRPHGRRYQEPIRLEGGRIDADGDDGIHATRYRLQLPPLQVVLDSFQSSSPVPRAPKRPTQITHREYGVFGQVTGSVESAELTFCFHKGDKIPPNRTKRQLKCMCWGGRSEGATQKVRAIHDALRRIADDGTRPLGPEGREPEFI